jgi:prolyl oligopeptidase
LTNYPKYGTPFKKNGMYYFYTNNGLQNQSVLYRSATENGVAELVLDPNKLSTDGTVALNAVEFSNNGKYLAYSISRSGSDWNEIYVMDLASKQLLPDVIKWVKFSGIAWKGDGFFYSAYSAPEAGKEYSGKNEFHKVFYHKLGDVQGGDQIVFENKEHPLRNCGASVSEDESYLFITETETTTGNSLYFKNLTVEGSKVEPIVTTTIMRCWIM